MTDLQILELLVRHSKSDELLTGAARSEYEKLVRRFSEDGFEIELPGDIHVGVENALTVLEREGYIKTDFRHGSDGSFYRIDLRGEKFQSPPTLMQPVMISGGERETFASGAVRDAADGKPRPDLISPFAVERLAAWLRLGAEKYAERNWERGIPVSRTAASLCRHWMKYQQGLHDEDHLAAVMCNAMMIAHTEEMVKRGILPDELLDLPDYKAIPNVHRNADEPYDIE